MTANAMSNGALSARSAMTAWDGTVSDMRRSGGGSTMEKAADDVECTAEKSAGDEALADAAQAGSLDHAVAEADDNGLGDAGNLSIDDDGADFIILGAALVIGPADVRGDAAAVIGGDACRAADQRRARERGRSKGEQGGNSGNSDDAECDGAARLHDEVAAEFLVIPQHIFEAVEADPEIIQGI